MTITQAPAHPSNYGGPNRGRRYIIVHASGGSYAGGISWIQNPSSNVSYHYLVSPEGEIAQLVPEDERAWHAGVSRWGDDQNLNDLSVGVAFAHPNTSRVPYTHVAVAAMRELVLGIMARHHIAAQNVLAHHEVSPGRKTDPVAFDMNAFRDSLTLEAPFGTLVEHTPNAPGRTVREPFLVSVDGRRVTGKRLDVRWLEPTESE